MKRIFITLKGKNKQRSINNIKRKTHKKKNVKEHIDLSKVKLLPITKKDYHSIYNLTTDKRVIKYVGNGKVWDKRKVNNYIKYNIIENDEPYKTRTHFSFKIVDLSNNKPKFIGIIEFHTFPQLSKYNKQYNKFKNIYFLTIFIKYNKQKLGYASKAINLIIQKYKQYKLPYINKLYNNISIKNSLGKNKFNYIYSMVRINNIGMINFSRKHKFKLILQINFNKEKFNIYAIPL